MATVADVIRRLDAFAPPEGALPDDPAGLAFGDPDAPARRTLFALDADESVLERARSEGMDLVACHHPRIFRPLASLAFDRPGGRLAAGWAASGVAVYSSHTALDLAPGGVADALASAVGLPEGPGERTVFARVAGEPWLKAVVFAPDSHLETVRRALADVGAGAIGKYTACSFRSRGIGTFLPGAGAKPFLGAAGSPETVEEWRLEAVLPRRLREMAEAAIRHAHPYEEPAFDFIPLAWSEAGGFGRAGDLPESTTLGAWALRCLKATGSTETRIQGDPGRRVRRVGALGGRASGDMAMELARLGVEAAAVGEAGYHDLEQFAMAGIGLVLLGHGWSERPGLLAWADHLRRTMPEVETRVAPPTPGAVCLDAWSFT